MAGPANTTDHHRRQLARLHSATDRRSPLLYRKSGFTLVLVLSSLAGKQKTPAPIKGRRCIMHARGTTLVDEPVPADPPPCRGRAWGGVRPPRQIRDASSASDIPLPDNGGVPGAAYLAVAVRSATPGSIPHPRSRRTLTRPPTLCAPLECVLVPINVDRRFTCRASYQDASYSVNGTRCCIGLLRERCSLPGSRMPPRVA